MRVERVKYVQFVIDADAFKVPSFKMTEAFTEESELGAVHVILPDARSSI